MKVDKQSFNTKAINLFREEKFTGIFNSYDLGNEEKLLKCKVPPFIRTYFEDKEETYIKGYELKDNNNKITYLIPSKVEDDEGNKIPITKLFPIKIKGSYEVYHGKKVYHYVPSSKMTSVAFPESDRLDVKTLIDNWLDIEHNNPNDLFVAKVSLLSSMFGGFPRLIGDKGFLKDGLVNSLIGITGIGNNISKVASDAKWIKLIDDKWTVFNEISGFDGDRLTIAENFFLVTGDENTPEYNHSTTGNESTGNKRDISKYSYTIMHNPPTYYMEKGKIPFEQMFQPAVFDRFIPLKLEGRVDANNSFQNPSIDFEDVMKKSMAYYKLFIGKIVWLMNNGSKIPLKYDIKKYNLSYEGREETSSRWMNTWIHIAQVVQEYSSSEAEFYEKMDLVYDSHKRAVREISELGLVS